MKEEWKFILGYDNYMISSHGRVRYEVTINRYYVGSFGDLEEAISRRDDYLSTIK